MSEMLPDPLTLQQHLDLSTVKELAEFLRFWAPHEKRRNGRASLVDRLQRAMSDENIVYAKVDLLSDTVRRVLLGLLRKTHYSGDLQGLFRGIEGLDMEHYEAEAALTALAKRGFVRQIRAANVPYGRAVFSVPLEMALVMRGLAGVDTRPLDQVMSHETFRPGGVEAASNRAPGPLPESVEEAVAALPNRVLQTVARECLERFGGILARREFAEVFRERNIRWRSGQFLREFGKRGLGTVGHLDLRAKAIGVDDDVLTLFHEAFERYVEEWRQRPLEHDRILTAHGDLMSDVRNTLDLTTAFPLRVAKEGAVYKSARGKLAEQLQFPEQPLLDPLDVADRALEVCRNLGLAATNGDGALAPTEKAAAWVSLPLLDKLKQVYAGFGVADGAETLRALHLFRMQRILTDLLARGREWWPGRSLAFVARNRYMLELAASDAPPYRAPLTVLPGALTELAHAAHDLVVRDLFSLGLVDVAMRAGTDVGVRLSPLGARLLRNEQAPDPDARALIVNPDFELLVLPEGDVDDLLHELDRFAVRTGTGEVVHYRLDRGRIERATVGGENSDAVLALLEAHCRSPIPQNVIYSIRAWCDDVRSASLTRGVLFKTNDRGVVETILNHAALKPLVESVVDGTTIFFSADVSEAQLAQELRALGIYVT